MKRLQAIFSLITHCKVFADIGTDHGQIASFAADKADRVIATDISEQCLSKARHNIAAGNVEFAAGDGLLALKKCEPPVEPDQISVCGMGGRTIMDILIGYRGEASLILQPQTDAPLLREFLCDNCFVITHDITAFEGRKYYDIIRAENAQVYREKVSSRLSKNKQTDTQTNSITEDIAENVCGMEKLFCFGKTPNRITEDIIYSIINNIKSDPLALLFGAFYKNKNALLRQRLLALRQKYQGYKQCEKNIKILADIGHALTFQNPEE